MNLKEALQFLKKAGWLFADHRHIDVGKSRHFPEYASLRVVWVDTYPTVNCNVRLPTNIRGFTRRQLGIPNREGWSQTPAAARPT